MRNISVCSWSYRLSAERVAEEMAKCDVDWRGSAPNDTVNRYSRGGFVMVDPSVHRSRVLLLVG